MKPTITEVKRWQLHVFTLAGRGKDTHINREWISLHRYKWVAFIRLEILRWYIGRPRYVLYRVIIKKSLWTRKK